ncbi:LRR_6 domain-containing protein [Cephalotus follicularis]|uniref:LRR_6 domain-containing protein n=1 Tax=Cephalotus follicularis TaxID=3775 RepID=A0A1Q3BN41_CEPFO|nr:LRR_6 domain-containing protein [Cephalotus follicularis]
MSHSPEKNPNPELNPKPPRSISLPDIWFKEKRVLKHVIHKMRAQSLSATPSLSPPSEPDDSLHPPAPDFISLLSDELLLIILSKLPINQHVSNSLVCKRWLSLHGRLVQSLELTDWSFLISGRVFDRFPNLTDLNLVRACIRTPRNSGILVTSRALSLHVGADKGPSPNGFCFISGELDDVFVLPSGSVDRGLEMVAGKCRNLRRLVAIGASDNGLVTVARECDMLQELELHCCGDLSLKGIYGCQNLQVVKLIGSVNGFYNSVVTDIGLTLLAQGCRRLVKLELCGCEGSYDGIKAIGQCCQMLEELTLCDHRMDGGWLSALSFCGNLKTLRLQSCKVIDSSPGPDEHLGSCPALEELHLERCQLRDKQSAKALFWVCETVREIVLQDCWGLVDEVFGFVSICRRVKLISLEGCALLTIGGLESVILSWKELQRLRVVSCNNMKDSEITPELASLFFVLKELKWRPDSRSLLSSSLAGSGVGKKGGRFFKRLKH